MKLTCLINNNKHVIQMNVAVMKGSVMEIIIVVVIVNVLMISKKRKTWILKSTQRNKKNLYLNNYNNNKHKVFPKNYHQLKFNWC